MLMELLSQYGKNLELNIEKDRFDLVMFLYVLKV